MLCYRCGSHNPDGTERCSHCGTPFMQRLSTTSRRLHEGRWREDLAEPGRVFAGRYDLKRFMGSGPNGDVYLARDVVKGGETAIKIFERSKFSSDSEREAFIKGMRSIRKQIHPNLIVPTEAGVTDDGVVYVTSRFVQGVSLGRTIESRSTVGVGFGLREIEPLFAQLKEGLGHLHPRVAHGDLKPYNIIIQPDYLRITDLGLAQYMPRQAFASSQRRESDSSCIAPEVLAGEAPTAASDVYSAGRLLVMMLLGQIPPDPASARFYEGDAELDELLRFVYMRAVAENPEERFRGIRDLWKSLDGAFTRFAVLPSERQTTSKIVASGESADLYEELVIEQGEPVEAAPETPQEEPGGSADNQQTAKGGKIGLGRRLGVIAAVLVPLVVAAFLAVYMGIANRAPEKTLPPPAVADAGNVQIENKGPDAAVPGMPGTDAGGPKTVEAVEEEAPAAAEKPVLAPEQERPDKETVSPQVAKGAQCPSGMAYIGAGAFYSGSKPGDPMRNPDERAWEVTKTGAFCIDLYEYPNGRGMAPMTSVSLVEAKSLCRSAGKRLCGEDEWERACKGPVNRKYPYGNDWDAAACNTESKVGGGGRVAPAGKFAGCKSGFGIFDASGNAAEWVTSSRGTVVKGGSASKPDWASRCASRAATPAGKRNPQIGFRCCRDPIY